jgi:predicted N-acyltransferase
MKVKQIQSMSQVDAAIWNHLAGELSPFMRHEFLFSLEQSGSIGNKTGWQSAHLVVLDESEQEYLALMPLYLKGHSWGEYVFDHQWAQAYQQHGMAYYPKWLTAIPFTPCHGNRMIIAPSCNPIEVMQVLVTFIQTASQAQNISSWHCLFPSQVEVESLQELGLSIREQVQFHWFNRNYGSFEDYLSTFSSSKRKMLKRERRRIQEDGIQFVKLMGKDVSDEQWQVFYAFYAMTYVKKGSLPYLNLAFFQQIAQTMGENILLVFAVKNGEYIAAALSFIGQDTLYGRYWGCLEEYSGLHFETCYYQGIDYCIEEGLKRFDSGAQGEHKISRGFEPITTYSAHWIQDENFKTAINHFLVRETESIRHYKMDAASYLPFKNNDFLND